jgi:hypothetical protein
MTLNLHPIAHPHLSLDALFAIAIVGLALLVLAAPAR